MKLKRIFSSHSHICTLAIVALLAIVTSCGESYAPERIHRLDLALEQDNVPDSLKKAQQTYYEIMGLCCDGYRCSKTLQAFMPIVKKELPALDSVEQAIGNAYGYLQANLPDAPTNKLYGVILPYSQSIVLAPDMTFVGLNHYLGPNSEAYEGFPEYQRRFKTLSRLPDDIVIAAIMSGYHYKPGDSETLVNRMLYSGAVAIETAKATEKEVEDVQGFTPEQRQWLKNNQEQAWNALVSRKLLYSTDSRVIENLTCPGPGATALHQEAPQFTGSWIGAQIAKKYAKKHPKDNLLSPNFYANPQRVLQETGYNGK